MTKEETIRLHRELWNWLAENPKKSKESWPGWKGRLPVTNNCFLCAYAEGIDEGETIIRCCCLLDWELPGNCQANNSYYTLYEKASSDETRSMLARKIANLKESKR
jgi:hypothetical protein